VPPRLVDRDPVVTAEQLVAGLVPPPMFRDARFETFRPDPAQPTQARAAHAVQGFASAVGRPARGARFRRRTAPAAARGIYLDGGFGVGKTHLLSSLWHAVEAPRAYATFVELTQLAGVLGFGGLVERLAGMRLLAIDEFELDDPGDTVLMSSLLAELADRGVALAATSNTLPDRLGEDRFATADFLREIQGLAARFTAVRIDGPDYRHRGLMGAPVVPAAAEVRRRVQEPGATLDDFGQLLGHLSRLHPSRYGALVDGVSHVGLTGVSPVPDQSAALRVVVLADRLYDRQIPVSAAGLPWDLVFPADMLAGGYRAKYRRAISRLVALARAGEQAEPRTPRETSPGEAAR
jgi:cell division protein ZapE